MLVASIRNRPFDTVYSARVMLTVSAAADVAVSVGDAESVGVRVEVAGEMGVAVGVRVDVALDPGVDVYVDEGFVVTVVTWLAELFVLFGSNSCPETKASLSRLPVACGMVATTVTLALAPVPTEPKLQVNVLTASGVWIWHGSCSCCIAV